MKRLLYALLVLVASLVVRCGSDSSGGVMSGPVSLGLTCFGPPFQRICDVLDTSTGQEAIQALEEHWGENVVLMEVFLFIQDQQPDLATDQPQDTLEGSVPTSVEKENGVTSQLSTNSTQ